MHNTQGHNTNTHTQCVCPHTHQYVHMTNIATGRILFLTIYTHRSCHIMVNLLMWNIKRVKSTEDGKKKRLKEEGSRRMK